MPTPFSSSLTSRVYKSGDYRIDALLGGRKWGGPTGTGTELTYSFPHEDSVFSRPYGYGLPWDEDYGGLNATQQFYFAHALNAWAEVANIRVMEVPDTAQAVGDIRVAFSGVVADAGAGAWGAYPSSDPIGGDVWLNPIHSNINRPVAGSPTYETFLHELGHALGLSHSFGGSWGGIGALMDGENSNKYTVMAYENYNQWNAQTPMIYDILAIQYIYGANYSTNAGDTTYIFSNTKETLMTIWDGGGNDTINTSNQILPVDINLIDGTFSSIGPGKYVGQVGVENVAIAFGAIIENAIGGSADDTITGNAVDNVLQGLDGDDSLKGLGGNDALFGGLGDDTLAGNVGDDLIEGGAGEDWVLFTENLGSYSVSFDADDKAIVSFTGPGSNGDGSDVVSDVEWFRFKDANYGWKELFSVFGGNPQPNQAPRATDDAAVTDEDQAITLDVLANDTDPDLNPLTVSAVGPGAFGTVSINENGTVTYTPDGDAHGTDTFTYTLSDGKGGFSTAIVSVTVNPINDAPVAFDDSVKTTQNQAVTFFPLSNDGDPDEGDTLALLSITGTTNGTTRVNADGSATYTPNGGFTGAETLTYVIADDAGATSAAQVGLTITPTGDDDAGGNDDVIGGTHRNDRLIGTRGDDVIHGYAGSDRLYGRSGSDMIMGGDGDDRVYGGAGNDTIDGGAGDDVLFGNRGNDTFYFQADIDSDRIYDFERGRDIIRIDGGINGIDGFAALDDNVPGGDGILNTEDSAISVSRRGLVIDFGDDDSIEILRVGELDVDDVIFM